MVLEKEKQVVKNEKRQGVDNAPYGHTSYVIGKNLYPEGHPYNWQVIGSLEDLQAATLDDVKTFYNTWYVPNNATLVIAGDFDPAQAKEWVKKYFDEIPRGEDIASMPKQAAQLNESKRLYYEDNYARLPELRLTWPGVENYHEDAYALQILSSLMAGSKQSPMYKVIVEEKELSANVSMNSGNSELAGEISLSVRAFPGTDLNTVLAGMEEGFKNYEENPFTEADLARVKAGIETGFYNGLQSVLGKAFQLAQYNIFAGDPGYINEDIQKSLDVSLEDVQRVYEKYIKGRPYIATSFVPKGQIALILDNSEEAEVVNEPIVAGAEGEDFELPADTEYERTPSSFDRSAEPPFGTPGQRSIPEVWTTRLSNGMEVYGMEQNELPLVQFNITLDGGLMLESRDKTGVSNLPASMMMRGTAGKTATELEEAIDLLGASISIRSGSQSFTLSGSSLAKNFPAVMQLVEEILLEPRWDEREFELAKQSVQSQIAQQMANPNSIAAMEFNKLMYGEENIMAYSSLGTAESITAISMDDLKSYYDAYISPRMARMHVVGMMNREGVMEATEGLNQKWSGKEVTLPPFTSPNELTASAVYFYDVPNAAQSVLRVGYLGPAETDPDFYPATVMNYILGGGGFASRLTQELREGKGYTYGIGSGFAGSKYPGPFAISSGVRSNITYEALDLIKNILSSYPDTYSEADLENTKSFLLRSGARAFETQGAKLGMLENMSSYGWSPDYITEREEIVKNMNIDRIRELARSYADPNRMIYLVVGDASTQMSRLRDLGFGEPIKLN
jgi:zinc protease